MHGLILALVILLIFVLVLRAAAWPCWCDDSIETVATTTVTEEEGGLNIVGNLKRQVEGLQSFVIDPVDNQKVWVNSNDDMYEDAAGKNWRLV